MLDDLVFFSSLLGCISLGSYYKRIDDMNMKRNYGAGLGLLVATLLCGYYVYHSVIMVWGNIIIIKCCDRRYLHYISLSFTWLYLVYLYLNLRRGSPYLHWIFQTIALRLVGLAFEVHLTATNKHRSSKSDQNAYKAGFAADKLPPALKTDKLTEMKLGNDKIVGIAPVEIDLLTTEPTAVEIIAYSYFFIGLHKGPYYRWKIFDDHFHSPFGVLGDCRVITEQKMKKAIICCFGYMLLRMNYAPEAYYDAGFYESYDNEIRYLYSLPQLMMYFLYYQMVMMLCTSVCTETGFGVYPAKCFPVPGHGPTTRLSLLEQAATTPDVVLEQEYNFSMLKCFENKKILFGPKMSDTIQAWDMPTRYWFWVFIYKNSVRFNKEIRSACSFLAWMLWVGPSLQRLIITVTMWIYLKVEAEYSDLYNTKDSSLRTTWNIGYSIMRVLCLIYLTPCLIVRDSKVILKYYNSILWSFHIVLFILLAIAIAAFKRRQMRMANSKPSYTSEPENASTSKSQPAK